MCGRFSLTKTEVEINQRFNVSGGVAPYIPRFNAAPGQNLAVITNQTPEKISLMKWGLVPFWAKDPAIGNKMINAKSETAHQKPSFREAFKKRRCLVISDGFFEWNKQGREKIPHYIFLEGHKLFAMARLWETWKDNTGEPLHTFTILTTSPNSIMKNLHNRMPVILPQNEEENWLQNPSDEDTEKLLLPYPGKLELYPVSKEVNSPRNDAESVIQPLPGYSPSLFD
ncbi:MAG: SOS response-associated peptidase [Bacteroidota bacterium]